MTAVASDGSYIIAPVEFGPVEVVSVEAIKARFGVTVAAPATQPQRRGFEQLAEASRLNANRIDRAHDRQSTEQAKVNASEERGRVRFAEALEQTR